MTYAAYRDGVGDQRALLAERDMQLARLVELRKRGLRLTPALAQLHDRLMRPIQSSVDVADRRSDLRAFDAELEACWAVHRQAPGRRRVRVVLVAVASSTVLGVALWAPLSRADNRSTCAHQPLCAVEGRCSSTLAAAIGLTSTDDPNACIARSDADCIIVCHSHGRCVVQGDICVPRGHSCENSEACAQRGACENTGETCEPITDAHCERSAECPLVGACGVSATGACAPLDQDHCEQSYACTQGGACRLGIRAGEPTCVHGRSAPSVHHGVPGAAGFIDERADETSHSRIAHGREGGS